MLCYEMKLCDDGDDDKLFLVTEQITTLNGLLTGAPVSTSLMLYGSGLR